MAELYESRHTGAEIDDAVGRAKVGGEIDAILQKKVNTNLLDNWYFPNLVNQRGISSGTGPVNAYGIDRWKCLNAGTLTIGSDYIAIASDTHPYTLQQYIEPGRFAGVIGMAATLSALVKGNGRLKISLGSSSVGAYSDYFSYSDWTLVQMQGTIVSGTDYHIYVQAKQGSGNCYVKAVKLELGSQQTLAHQDADGNWVLNEIPDYGEQLRRCQRYSVHGVGQRCSGYAINGSDRATIFIPTPVTMRTIASAEIVTTDNLVTSYGDIIPIKSFSPAATLPNGVVGDLQINSPVTQTCVVAASGFKCNLIADL